MPRSSALPGNLRRWTAQALRTGSSTMNDMANLFATDGPQFSPSPHEATPAAPDHVASSGATLTSALRSHGSETTVEHHIEAALQNAAQSNGACGVIQVDIDQFSALNASYGHDVGDEVLAEVAERITNALRPTDFVSRLQHDEFVIVCRLRSDDGETAHIVDLGQRIQRSMDQPVPTAAGEIRVTIAVGMTSVEKAGLATASAPRLMQQAKTAAEQAARKGRSQMAAFDAEMHQRAADRYRTEHELRGAIRDGRLGVHYQPFYKLNSGGLAGLEALARWSHPDMGAISPGLFIPVAEESGLIHELGTWIMKSAIDQAAAWNELRVDSEPKLVCTINLSSRQLLDPGLVGQIATQLQATGLDPTLVCLEITESVVMSDVAASMTILGELKDLGVVLAIDDFGTGYSSLSYLRRLPVDILKIDMSFVQSLHNRDDRMITRAIIDLAHTLGMTTVAEGVESMLQVEILDALECDMVQGFLLHHPKPADEIQFGDVELSARDASKTVVMPTTASRLRPL